MFLLAQLAHAANKPIFYLPGVTCSPLYVTFQGYSKHYYCPRNANRMKIWPNQTLTSSDQGTNCLLSYFAHSYNPETENAFDDHYSVESDPIGTTDSATAARGLLTFFETKGYTENKDFFAVPYDWRESAISLKHKQDLFPKLKAAIEKAYEDNANQRAVLIGWSMGTLMVNIFTNTFCTKEWREKYLDALCFIAPAFAGSSNAVESHIGYPLQYLSYGSKDIVADAAGRIPGLYALFPNYVAYGDSAIVTGPNGETYSAKDLPEKVFPHFNVFRGESPSIYKTYESLLSNAPPDSGVRSCVVYNTKYQTSTSYDFTNGWDNPKKVTSPGDGLVPAVGIEWVCKNWTNVQCNDFACTENCGHSALAWNSKTYETFYSFIYPQQDPSNIE